jgi:UDP-glucuronate 4-epimerase
VVIKKILVTGAAGFIGFHLAQRLLDRGDQVCALDNMNDYYDVNLKQDRVKLLEGQANFMFIKADITDRKKISTVFAGEKFDVVVNLAAQPGVRYSLINPYAYIDNNVVGFLNVLEGCRHNNVKHIVFASSSSVYGANTKIPYSVHDNVDHPVSLYAASKKANELMAHSYASLYGIPATGLRFFTVYGPWGRPDMAYFSFTKAILEGTPIQVYNYGEMKRDFTYVDDIVEGVVRVIDTVPQANPSWSGDNPDPGSSNAPFKVYNIGNHQPVGLLQFINILESNLRREAIKNLMPMQAGDVLTTYADIRDLNNDVGFTPCTSIEEGLKKFVAWYRSYYSVI